MWQFRLNRLRDAAYFFQNLGFSEGDISPTECMARILVEEAMITNNAFTACYLKYKGVSSFMQLINTFLEGGGDI